MKLTIVGFDVVLMNNFYAYPAFRNRFGVPGPNGTYQIPAKWQAGLGNGSAVGQFIGLLLNGVGPAPFPLTDMANPQIIAERYGYRKVMIWSLAYMSCIFFLHFFAQNLGMLLAAQILVGVPCGSESTCNWQLSMLMVSLSDLDDELCVRGLARRSSSVSQDHVAGIAANPLIVT